MAGRGQGPTRLPMLPRSHSTPSTRHWMLEAEAAGAAAGSHLGRSLSGPSNGPRRTRPTRFSGAAASRWGSTFMAGGQRPYHAGRQRAKADLANAMATRDEDAQLRRLRQVASASQWNREVNADVKKVDSRISELYQCQQPQQSFSEMGERALLGIERPRFYDFGDRPEVEEPASPKGNPHDVDSKKPKRQMSVPSSGAIEQLEELDVRLSVMEDRIAELHRLAKGAECPIAEGLGQMKTELAQLEAEANKLESKGVDSVYTSELASGQAIAKQLKKAQLKRLESLFTLIEQLFRLLSSKG